jgi:hypothetical protein
MPRRLVAMFICLIAPLAVWGTPAGAPATRSRPVLDHSSPKALLRSFFTTGGDVDEQTMRSLFHATNPVEQKLVDATVQIAMAQSRLRAAQVERFGKSPTAGPAATGIPQPADLAEIDSLHESVQGDHAVVTVPNSPGIAMEFVRIDGQWKLPISPLASKLDPPNAQLLDKGIQAQVEVMDSVTSQVKAGAFASEQAVQDELKKRLAEKMQEMIRQATPSSAPAATAPASP